jgi:hypothetical protein
LKPDSGHHAGDILAGLTSIQRAAVRILHLKQPTPAVSSGIPIATFRALRARHLVVDARSEADWYLTELGQAVQLVQDREEGRKRLR